MAVDGLITHQRVERFRVDKRQRKILLNDHVEEGIVKSDFGSLSQCALIKKGRWRWERFAGIALELRVSAQI